MPTVPASPCLPSADRAAPRDKVGEPHPLGVDRRGRFQAQLLAHLGQNPGIDPVGLGQFPHRAGEFAGLTGVDAAVFRARLGKGLCHGTLIAARGFKDDQ